MSFLFLFTLVFLIADNTGWLYRIPYNYHLYRVKEDVDVLAGPIAPFFEQPGQGVQYQLLPAGIRTVADLIAAGILVAEDSLELYDLGSSSK